MAENEGKAKRGRRADLADAIRAAIKEVRLTAITKPRDIYAGLDDRHKSKKSLKSLTSVLLRKAKEEQGLIPGCTGFVKPVPQDSITAALNYLLASGDVETAKDRLRQAGEYLRALYANHPKLGHEELLDVALEKLDQIDAIRQRLVM